MPRTYNPRERRLIAEWMAKNHPNVLQWKRQRLGALPFSPEAKLYKGLRRWVDEVFLEGGVVFLVEAKMRPMPEGLAQLELYDRLFTKTPEFKELWDNPRRLIYLTTKYDETIDEMAKEKGIELIVYTAGWVDEWWREKIAKMSR